MAQNNNANDKYGRVKSLMEKLCYTLLLIVPLTETAVSNAVTVS